MLVFCYEFDALLVQGDFLSDQDAFLELGDCIELLANAAFPGLLIERGQLVGEFLD